MSSPIFLPPLLPLPPSPLPPLHSPIVLPRSIEDLLMLSMFILLVIAILCGKRSTKSDEEELLLENLDIQASIFSLWRRWKRRTRMCNLPLQN
uniref:Uncharacterized protein n=1 Tax=Cucumis melo TaxID=3656 RepID=A0A9I9EKY6_CUCME